MHIATKITLGAGAVLLIGSVLAMVVGGGSFIGDLAENPDGTELWNGTSPTTYEGNFEYSNYYIVFTEEGSDVEIEVLNGNEDNRFMPCEEDDSCDYYSLPGYTYVGDIYILNGGVWEVEFTGNGGVIINELTIDIGGAMAMGLGFWGFCCSFCVLGLGIIFIFTLKDNKMQQGVMMVQQADGTIQPVGGMATPAQGTPMVAGAVHPAYTQQQPVQQQGVMLPPIGGQQPPNQGF
ncbi:MAG: hypothetical protein HOE69_04850 [Euryarchaeota archaeon]|jgi:hypothetical protein|nr:hypothetical protein [Euryarchaeota archaeon]